MSPLRIAFHTDDPLRRGREFILPSASNPDASPRVLQQASTPQPSELCFSLRTTLLQAFTLIVRGEERGVDARFNSDGQLMISGYALLDAGLISAEFKVTCALWSDECDRHQLGILPLNTNAIDPLLLMYIDALKDATNPVLRRNYLCAVGWLMASGKVDVIEAPVLPPAGQQPPAN